MQQGCRHRAAYQGGVSRRFEFLVGSIEPTAFLRALLAIELEAGPFTQGPADAPLRVRKTACHLST